MKKRCISYVILIVFAIFFLSSCKKEWLDAKSDKSLIVPKTLQDLQLFINNTSVFNTTSTPKLGEMSADDYYLKDSIYLTRPELDQKVYTWSPGFLYIATPNLSDWDVPYRAINYANITLETLASIEKTSQNHMLWNDVKGQALFYRAHAYYQLAQVFCKPFRKSTAIDDLGLVIRTSSDINLQSIRYSVQQTYDLIIEDLLQSKELLSALPPSYPTNPFKATALALLARTYLTMEMYDSALLYADASLQIKSTLVNYTTYNASHTNPIPAYSPEILFDCSMSLTNSFPHNNGQGIVDTFLYSLFSPNDTRQTIFFKNINGRRAFCGSYTGIPTSLFGGIATDEMFLIRSECYARNGNINLALEDLNKLVKSRWRNVPYTEITAVNTQEALQKILTERRKELCFRGLRWTDLRRLNHDPLFQKTLTRTIFGQNYSLPPNDIKYVFPLPDSEILYSGVQQNPR